MSLYLKYRPQDFDNLMGQSFVKNTLQKAIAEEKTVGAYLLCGPRGTGKTTTARLLAKALNCLDLQNGSPCTKCEVCMDFVQEKLIDIIEIDAASHTGVDNIRAIIEKAQFRPTKTKFKVYIIDEVHMLSTGAFNALLKILEEPPEHVKFILATTETHKVPETIISRCQRYDFKRISPEDIKQRLEYIAKEEQITIDEDSLKYIVKNAGGGLRNAISTFEQLVENNTINYQRVIEKLEITGKDILKDFSEKLIKKDITVIDIFDKLVEEGKNMKLFFKELLYYIKDDALEKCKEGKNIHREVHVLQLLDETYTKTKHSLDEQMTFLIGILELLQEEALQKKNSTVIQKSSNVIIPEEKSAQINIKEPSIQALNTELESSISPDDIMGVFDTPKIESTNTQSVPQAEQTGNVPFSISEFISKLKVLGAKGGLTMALRGAQMNLRENNLHITIQTKIALGQIQNIDNQSLMNQALSQMGVIDSKITY